MADFSIEMFEHRKQSVKKNNGCKIHKCTSNNARNLRVYRTSTVDRDGLIPLLWLIVFPYNITRLYIYVQ